MEREDFVFHMAICENDNVIQGKLSSYATSFSTELGLTVNIHQYIRMPLNPQEFITTCNYMNLIVISTEFEEKGISLCKELLSQNSTLPVILVSKDQVMSEAELPLVGILKPPVASQNFRLLFHRAVGQMLCKEQIRSGWLNVIIGKKRVALDYKLILSCTKIGEKVAITCVQESYLVSSSLKKLKDKLPDHFIQINQRTIINVKKMQVYDPQRRKVRMRNKEEYEVTPRYMEILQPFLKNIE